MSPQNVSDPTDYTDVLLTKPQAESEWTTEAMDISAYQGQNARFAFVNNSNDKYLLLIDNITVTVLNPNDLGVSAYNGLKYLKAGDKLNVTIQNFGQDVSGATLSYAIDGGAAISQNATLNLEALGFTQLDLSTPISAMPGFHQIKIWTSQPDGNADTDPSNDTLTVDVVVYDELNTVNRNVLMEVFTSSTCPPCKPGNEKITSVVNSLNYTPVIVKYQQDFPGTGDPYNTVETVARREYYGINAIPQLNMDGGRNFLNPNSLSAADVDDANAQPDLATIDAKYDLDTAAHSIHIFGSYTAETHIASGTKLMIAIMEKETKKNKKDNDETAFFHVVKKLWNGMDGVTITNNLNPGDKVDFDYTYTFPGDYRLQATG